MEHTRITHDIRPEVTRKIKRCAKVHGAADHRGQFENEAAEAEHARRAPRLKLDKHIDIALGREVVAEDAAKEREAQNAVTPAEVGDLLFREVDAVDDHAQAALYALAKARALIAHASDGTPSPWADDEDAEALLAEADALIENSGCGP